MAGATLAGGLDRDCIPRKVKLLQEWFVAVRIMIVADSLKRGRDDSYLSPDAKRQNTGVETVYRLLVPARRVSLNMQQVTDLWRLNKLPLIPDLLESEGSIL